MSVIIPFQDFPSFRQEVTLDGNSYSLLFNWNTRFLFWSMSFYTPQRAPIVTGIKLVLDGEFLTQFPDYGLPPGQMTVGDPSGSKARIEKDDFINERCFLTYFTEDEVEAAQ
jgi:hypothetical protein